MASKRSKAVAKPTWRLDEHNTELAGVNRELEAVARREQDQRGLAEERERVLHRLRYADRLAGVSLALDHGHLGRAAEWLGGLRPRRGQEDLRGFEWHYLRGLAHPLRAVWRGHRAGIDALAVSPDGKTVASRGGDGNINLWDLTTGEVVTSLNGTGNIEVLLAFSTDGRTLFSSASKANEIWFWDVASGQRKKQLRIHSSDTWVAGASDGKTVALADGDRGVTVIDTDSGKETYFRCTNDDEACIYTRRSPLAGGW